MKVSTRLQIAALFGTVTLLTILALLAVLKVPGSDRALISQLPLSSVIGVMQAPALAALLLGAAFSGLFARLAALRLGVLYTACLGLLLSVPVVFLGTERLNELIFALTFTAFDAAAAPGDTAVAVFSGRTPRGLELLVWSSGPLTGLLAWVLLRRPRRPVWG